MSSRIVIVKDHKPEGFLAQQRISFMDWAANAGTADVIAKLEKIADDFNGAQSGNKKISYADIIVLGPRPEGRSPATGGTIRRVLREAPCSVWLQTRRSSAIEHIVLLAVEGELQRHLAGSQAGPRLGGFAASHRLAPAGWCRLGGYRCIGKRRGDSGAAR